MYMELRKYDPGRDFEIIKNWIDDERTHAMWCANLFDYPLNRENVAEVLSYAVENYGDVPFVAIEEGREVGFFCYNTNQTTKENIDKVLALKVDESQKSFVSTNGDSLAQAYVIQRH